MHRDQRFHPKAVPPGAYQWGDNYMNLPVPSSFPEVLPPPIYGVEFQPSEACPKNFVIVDQTDHRSQIMFNPAFAHKFPATNFNGYSSGFMHESYPRKDVIKVEKELSVLKEDSDDIDALLSLDDIGDNDEEDGVYDEDEVSTARTYGTYGCSSPESCSNYNYNYNNSRSNACSSSSARGSSSETKQLKMKRMVKALRGIIPGADQMNTVTVIDEAIRYLKSIKVEAEKLGVGNMEDYN